MKPEIEETKEIKIEYFLMSNPEIPKHIAIKKCKVK